jgi:TolA-binding protein
VSAKPERAAIAVVLSCATSCAYYSQEDGEKLNNEVYALQTQVTAMQQAITQLQESEKRQEEKLGAMTDEVAELSKVARRNDADIGVQMEEMLQETSRMKGRVETFSERVSDIEAKLEKVAEELNLRFQGLAENQKISEAKSEEEKQKAIEAAKMRERFLGDPEALFREVEKMIGNNEAKGARALLREFELRADNDKRLSKSLDEAKYWIAETYLAEANFQQAAAEFNKVRKDFPKSKLEPEALFKLGVCFENLKLPADAKLFYQTVIKKHPRTKAAEKAKKRLKDIE